MQTTNEILLPVERKRNQDKAMNHENSNNRSKECSNEPNLLIFNFTLANLPSKPSTIPTTKLKIEAGNKCPKKNKAVTV